MWDTEMYLAKYIQRNLATILSKIKPTESSTTAKDSEGQRRQLWRSPVFHFILQEWVLILEMSLKVQHVFHKHEAKVHWDGMNMPCEDGRGVLVMYLMMTNDAAFATVIYSPQNILLSRQIEKNIIVPWASVYPMVIMLFSFLSVDWHLPACCQIFQS